MRDWHRRAPELYFASSTSSRTANPQACTYRLRGFDALITTCPLNISPRNVTTFVQTIHDLIPLEYVAHNEDPLMFSHRLQACIPANRIHVSQSTANKYNCHILNAHELSTKKESCQAHRLKETVITNSFLRFPNWVTEDPTRIADYHQ